MVDFRVDTSGATQSLLNLGERNIFLFPFFLGLLPFTLYFYWNSWYTLKRSESWSLFLRRPRYLWSVALLVLQGALTGTVFALELYFVLDCPVSNLRYDQMSSIFEENVKAFQPGAAAGQWHDRVFAAEGTMLALARGNQGLNVWDQDSGEAPLFPLVSLFLPRFVLGATQPEETRIPLLTPLSTSAQ